ncbi:hypothetical protein SAMN06265795_107110 [Noviherbaspirillum humi]|uniref:Uncharacterized protein n=1 Tax=Noviherbaspirillum humi TaxID=1688639 RepID=A0A239HQC3_9BURK|nr:hypothetical protein [Noviherbaspirillum humi]SNS83470.1 hypothetical protein SAMN06265795_107110 [Noviherbaspirillum humi]
MAAIPDLRENATNLVRRPVDGKVITASGRAIPQPPWIIAEQPATLVTYSQWLIDQGRAEAEDLGEDWMIARLAGISAGTMDDPTRELLSDFLFGDPHPEFEARSGPA